MKNLIKSRIRKVIYTLLVFSLFSTLLLFPKISLHAANDFNVTDMSATATVDGSTLNVRSGPGKDYDAIGKVSPGETLTVTGQTDNEWYRIDYSGKEGYVSSNYVTIGSGEASTAVANDPNDFTNYEEGAPQTDSLLTASPRMLILLGIIIVVVVIMIVTIIMIKKSDDDEYDEYEDDEYDDDYYEDDDDDEIEDEDEYEDDDEDNSYYEPVRRKKSKPQSLSTKRTGSAERPTNTKHPETKNYRETTKHSGSTKYPANQNPPQHIKSVPPVSATAPDMITEADYTLQIDPRIFDDEKLTSSPIEEPVAEAEDIHKEKEIAAAISKLEELQQEIERLKNNN
ncbi:MAG: SH3 domain-containing protein [Lachnospiraceae bacterium]|nr:SH3 domain-containing protein [Lachnospiraceae bacterium]